MLPRLSLPTTPPPLPALAPVGDPNDPATLPAAAPPPGASTEAARLDAWRSAMADGTCRPSLMPARDILKLTSQAANAIGQATGRIGKGDCPFSEEDRLHLIVVVDAVPPVLLPADAATGQRLWSARLRDPAKLAACKDIDLPSLMKLCFTIRDTIAPEGRGGARLARSADDLATLARLHRWTWPDIEAYLRTPSLNPEQRERRAVAERLRVAWEQGGGFGAVADVLVPGRPRPDDDLLRRMHLLARPSRPRVRFQLEDPGFEETSTPV